LPPPLRPMITVMELSGTSRSRPRRTGWPLNDFRSPTTLITGLARLRLRLAHPCSQVLSGEDRAEEKVPDEDEHRGEDHGLRGRRRHPLGAARDVETLVGAHPRHDHAEADGLPEAHHDVAHVHERLHLAEVRALAEPEELDADQVPAEDADH